MDKARLQSGPGLSFRNRNRIPLVATFAATLLAAGALFAYLSWVSYEDLRKTAASRAANLSLLLADRTGLVLEEAGAQLKWLARQVPPEALVAGAAAPINPLDALPIEDPRQFREFGAYMVIDAAGELRYSSVPGAASQRSFADQAWFRALRTAPPGDLYIADEFSAASSGALEPIIAWPIHDAAGRFIGATAVSWQARRIEDLLAAVDIGRHGMVALRRIADNAPVLCRPNAKSDSSPKISTPVHKLVQAGERAGFADYVSPVVGIERTYGFHVVDGFGIYAIVGAAKVDYLQGWRERTFSAALLGILLLGTLGVLIRRQMASESRLELQTAALRQAEFVGGLGHWQVEFPGNRLTCSAQTLRIFGQAEQLSTIEMLDRQIHPEDRERAIAVWEAAVRDGERYDIEYRIIVDDAVRHVAEHAVFDRDPQGRARYALGTVLDITERKSAEARLAREHALLQTIIEAIPDHLFVKDIDGVYQVCNPTMQKALNRPEQEIVGRTDVDLFGPRVGATHRERDVEAMRTGTPQSYEERMLDAAGVRHWVEKTKVPLLDDAGNCVGVLGLARDVTERRRSEQAVIESEARFRSLADSTPVMIWMMDSDGAGSYFNRAWLTFTGRNLEQELACKWREDIHPEDVETTLEKYRSALDERRTFSVEFRKRRHDGQWRWVLDHGAPRVDRNGSLLGFIGSLVDITERKQAEDELVSVGERLQVAMKAAGLVAFEHVTGARRMTTSPAFRSLLALDGEELTLMDFMRRVHPEDRGYVRQMLTEGGQPGHTSDSTCRLVLPGGAMRWVRTTGVVQAGPQGLRFSGVVQDVTARVLAARALTESERKYRTLLEAMGEGVYVVQDGRLAFVNPALAMMLGYLAEEMIGCDVRDLVEPAERETILARQSTAEDSMDERASRIELQMVRRDGRPMWAELIATPMLFAGRAARLVIVRDTSEHRRAEQRLRDANRRLRALVECRQSLVRAVDEHELLGTVCNVVVQTAGYWFAFVAFAEDDPQKTVRPVAHAGGDAGYLEALNVTWADTERGRGPTGTAIRTGKPFIARIATDPGFSPWREAALRRGYAANLALPLISDGRTFGAFAVYSGDEDAFDEDEVSVLAELANDLAFGIQALRSRAARQLAEVALRESEAKHRTLVDAMAEGVCVVHEQRMVFANASLATMLHSTVGDLIGSPIAAIAAPDGRDDLVAFFASSDNLSARPPKRREVMLQRSDREAFVAELIATGMFFNGWRAALVIVRDIDDLKRAEKALTNSEHFLRDVLESTSDGLLVEDRDGRTLATNRRFMQMWNVPAQMIEQLQGGGMHTHVLAQLDNAQSIPTRSADLDRMEQWREYHLLEVSDGRLIARNSSPLMRDGVVAGRVWSFRDVTERRKTELLYRSVIESSPDAFLAIDEEGRIVDWSPRAEELFGWGAMEIIGRSWTSTIVPVAYRETHEIGLRRFVSTGESPVIGRVLRQMALRRDGSEFPVELQIGAVRVGKRWRFTSFIRDISARVLAEQQVAQSQRLEAIGQLTGGLAHDFNNMLGIILGSLDLLSLDLGTSAGEAQELISAAQSAAHRGVEVTKSLLAVARRQPLAPKLVDIDAALRDMKPLLVQTAGKRVSLSMLLQGGGVTNYLDPGGLNNAVLNLVINARDAMPDGGHLHIATEVVSDMHSLAMLDLPDGSYLCLTIRDSGCGMAPEVVERAFDPFFTTKERGKGTGLGLAMVYGFARQSNGVAIIDSAIGTGTTVRLMLPVAMGKHQAEVVKGSNAGINVAANGEQVLVVDDEFDLRRIVKDYLSAVGYSVTTAGTPQEALALLESRHFDLLISDVVMPGDMDGADLARIAGSRYPDMRVMLISGYADDVMGRIPEHCRLLEKPFLQQDLQQAVREVLDQKAGEWVQT